jgi:hypothetical protein
VTFSVCSEASRELVSRTPRAMRIFPFGTVIVEA